MKKYSRRVLVGIALILLGLLFTLKNLDVFGREFEYYFLSYPVLLVAVGLIITFTSQSKFWGMSIVFVGAIFFTARFYGYPAGEIFSDIWPVFVILLGLSIIFDRKRHKKNKHSKCWEEEGFNEDWVEVNDDYLDLSTTFAGYKRKITSQNFRGAKISTIFGGTELDFSQAKLASNCIIECDTIFGGTELIIPSEWKIINQTSAMFGGVADERRKSAPVSDTEEVKLTVKGFALFGGIEIKS